MRTLDGMQTLTTERVLEIARTKVAERGWPWFGRIEVNRRRIWLLFGAYQWHVLTNADAIGANVRLVIDDRTGQVVNAGFALGVSHEGSG
jgi:hypothetical protein